MPVSLVKSSITRRVDVVRPVVDVDDALCLRRAGASSRQNGGKADGQERIGASTVALASERRAAAVSFRSAGRRPSTQGCRRQDGQSYGIALLLRRQRGRHRAPAGAAGEHDLLALPDRESQPDRTPTAAPPRRRDRPRPSISFGSRTSTSSMRPSSSPRATSSGVRLWTRGSPPDASAHDVLLYDALEHRLIIDRLAVDQQSLGGKRTFAGLE